MENTVKKVTVDATGKRLGRLASEIANMLNGKDAPDYAPNRVPNIVIEINNASHMQIDERKKKGKIYDHYTGYFSGRQEISLGQLIKKKGYQEALRKAVYGMLPSNRLRAVKMKKLQIHE